MTRFNCICVYGSGGLYKDAHVDEAPLLLHHPEEFSGWYPCGAKAVTTPKEPSSPASLAAGNEHVEARSKKNVFHNQ